MKISPNNPCPCGSLKKYKKCCKTFHNGTNPNRAVELMKSRFCAYAISNSNYIISTTHNDNQDFTNDIKTWNNSILDFCDNTEFIKVDILKEINGLNESFVTFKAHLIQDGKDASFIEKSRFIKENNKWFYVDGSFIEDEEK